MDDESPIRERIAAFLSDALAWSERNAINTARDDRIIEKMELAEEEKKILNDVHGAGPEALISLTLCDPPDHTPSTEMIQSIRPTSAGTALVETSNKNGAQFEYEMVKTNEQWRIRSLRQVFANKLTLPHDAGILHTLRQSTRAPLLYTELPEGLERLFEGPCILRGDQGEAHAGITTSELLLPIPSGWIACDDPGYWSSAASVFELSVPPGNYPLQMVRAGYEPLAVRVLIQPNINAVRYCKATRLMAEVPGRMRQDLADTNGIGVRTGRIGLADAASLYGMSLYDREKMDALACERDRTLSTVFHGAAMNNGVQAIHFDTIEVGGFKAYWALDVKDNPVALYFDLPYHAKTHYEECAILILSDKQTTFEHPSLTRAGLEVKIKMDGSSRGVVIVPRERWAKFAVSDASSRIIIHFDDHFGSSSSAEENCSYLPDDFQLPAGGLLHVRWEIGHSYNFLPPLPQTMANTPEAFGGLWHRCGCKGNGTHWQGRLRNRYESSPARCYHNWRHLTECLVELDSARSHYRDCDLYAVEMALWFHDVVYDPRAQDNEEKSAEGAVHLLQEGKASEKLIEKVSTLILATKTHPHQADADTALLLDIDLSILGKPPERYQAYEEAIRAEYEWVPLALFVEARGKILSRFLERDSIYLTDYFRERYEAQARVNLKRALEALTATLR